MDENEEIDSYEKQYAEAVSQKQLMSGLVEHSAFKFFVKAVEAQIDKRLHLLLVPPSGADDVVQKTYSAGEIAGMKVAINLPQIMIETAQGTIDMIKVNNERKEGKENG